MALSYFPEDWICDLCIVAHLCTYEERSVDAFLQLQP